MGSISHFEISKFTQLNSFSLLVKFFQAILTNAFKVQVRFQFTQKIEVQILTEPVYLVAEHQGGATLQHQRLISRSDYLTDRPHDPCVGFFALRQFHGHHPNDLST